MAPECHEAQLRGLSFGLDSKCSPDGVGIRPRQAILFAHYREIVTPAEAENIGIFIHNLMSM